MKPSAEHNAITERIERLQSLYHPFRQSNDAVLLHWSIQQDEVQMMDAFVKYENSECGVFPDLFFPLIAPFSSPEEYNQLLLDEVTGWIENDTQNLREEGYKLDFSMPSKAQDDATFLIPLSQFAQAIPELEHIVAVLDPTEIHSYSGWESWMLKLISGELPPKIRIMVYLMESYSPLSRLRQLGKNRVYAVKPDLDMQGAIKQLAATGDPKDPGVQYRMLFIDMGQAAGKNNLQKMRELGEKALNIAQQQQGWEHVEVTTYIAMGGFLLPHLVHQKEALQLYMKGLQVAEQAFKNKHPSGVQIFLQAHHAVAAAHFAMKNYEEAAKMYVASGVLVKDEHSYTFQQMESWRMAGYSYWQCRNWGKALEHYEIALTASEQLDPNIQADRMILSIGAGLMALIKLTSQYAKDKDINERMIRLAGPDWKEKIEKQKITP